MSNTAPAKAHVRALLSALEATDQTPLRALLGFDGFIDQIYRVERDTVGGDAFARVGDFGRQLVDSPGQNASFPLRSVETNIGGNMPIMANALARLGASVTGIGMIGYPLRHPIFDRADARLELLGFAEPVTTTALEFDDGKVLLADGESLATIGWETVVDGVGRDRLHAASQDRALIGLLNWSELANATAIWRGLLGEVLQPSRNPAVRPRILVDLADCTRKSAAQLRELAQLLSDYRTVGEVTLVLNEGEASHLARTLASAPAHDLAEIALAVHDALGVTVVVRNAWRAVGRGERESADIPTFHTDRPRVKTGAGDNFNAGYAFARWMGLAMAARLACGAAVAGWYVRTGESPTRAELLSFLESTAVPEEVLS